MRHKKSQQQIDSEKAVAQARGFARSGAYTAAQIAQKMKKHSSWVYTHDIHLDIPAAATDLATVNTPGGDAGVNVSGAQDVMAGFSDRFGGDAEELNADLSKRLSVKHPDDDTLKEFAAVAAVAARSETLGSLLDGVSERARRGLVRVSDDSVTLAALVDYDHEMSRPVAVSEHTSPETLDRISSSTSAEVRSLVAGNPSAGSETLRGMSTDPDSRVRERVAGNAGDSRHKMLQDTPAAVSQDVSGVDADVSGVDLGAWGDVVRASRNRMLPCCHDEPATFCP